MPRSWKPTQNNFKSVSSGAEDAIVARMQALVNDPNERRRALEDAVRQLRVIQVEKLNYPDWNKK